MTRILIVDDEPGIREALAYALERDGFESLEAATRGEATRRARAADLLVLDLMLPDGSGLELLSTLRARADTPVIVLSSRGDEADRVAALEMGADDYVTKPFSPRELVARIRAVLRRVRAAPAQGRERASDAELVTPTGLRLARLSRRAFVREVELSLSRLEFDLLAVFMQTPERVFERGQLLQKVWGPHCVVGERTVDVHLKALRKKIAAAGGDPASLQTVRGVGYRLRGARP
ncbi:MAG: response regulator transcription factor [Myxococcales bacterium]|nr:response regulator transcription factor [Myxococcales bacterium]